jgi:NADH-quinone oxidoreductase subunit A
MRRLGVMGLIELVVFVAILVIPFFYVWRKGAFTWE